MLCLVSCEQCRVNDCVDGVLSQSACSQCFWDVQFAQRAMDPLLAGMLLVTSPIVRGLDNCDA